MLDWPAETARAAPHFTAEVASSADLETLKASRTTDWPTSLLPTTSAS